MTAHFLSELLSFLDGLPEPRIVMNAEYRIIAANTAYLRAFGGGAAIVGHHCYEVSHHFNLETSVGPRMLNAEPQRAWRYAEKR